MMASTAAAALLAMTWQPATSQELTEINFVEAVHNLGYINLYVGQHAGIFEKHGLELNLSAAGGDTQAFAAVLGKSAQFAIGDATMAQMSRERGGPGMVVGAVIQRAHFFGVSKNLDKITDPQQFKGLTVTTSPDPNTNYAVTKKMLEENGLKVGVDTIILEVNPGTEIGSMLAGQSDMAITYQPNVAAAQMQGAKIVWDFATYMGPFNNTGIMVLEEYVKENPDVVQALVTAFEEASRLQYSDPDFAKEVAQKEFPDLAPEVVNAAIDAQLKYRVPAETVVIDRAQWATMIGMHKYLGNIEGTLSFDDIVDNSFAEKAVTMLGK
jgi:NitT/TauT family transport system substrate-binding protein